MVWAMLKRQRFALLAIAWGLAGCAIHPLPENVTGVKTATIVHKIRCEARAAVINAQIAYLHKTYPEVADLATLRIRVKQGVSKLVAYNLGYFANTGIVYSFSLDGTETNGATFTADVIKPLAHGTATLTPSLGNTLVRENIRAFTISDNFAGLIDVRNDEYCAQFPVADPNYEFPIVGRVGVDEIVTTFIELTVFDALSPKQDPAAPAPTTASPIAMVDTLNFTTTITAGITPKVTFTPVGTGLQFMDAMLPVTNMRVDKHQVIIGLALAKPYTPPGMIAADAELAKARWKLSYAPFVASNNPQLIIATSTADTGEGIALQAVNNQILRFEVPKSLIVVP
jgi:hypothetical protein